MFPDQQLENYLRVREDAYSRVSSKLSVLASRAAAIPKKKKGSPKELLQGRTTNLFLPRQDATTIKDMEEQRDEWVEKFEVLTKEFNDEREQWANRYRDLEEEKEKLYGEMKEEIEKTQTELEGEKNNSQELGRFFTEIIRHEKQNGTNTELLQELLEEHRALLNTGQKYDHVEKRQKKRKLSILKSRAEKALSFVKSFGLNITSLTVESDAGERINLKMAYKTISDNDKTVIEKALFLMDKFCASDEVYHELVQVSN